MHAYHLGGMPEIDVQTGHVVAGELGLDPLGVAHQGDRYSELPGCGYGTFDLNMRGVIAPHHIDSNSHISPGKRIS
ncbi:hypothetical protein GMSM_31540 [Geomonas sp. Red276]